MKSVKIDNNAGCCPEKSLMIIGFRILAFLEP